MKRHLLSMTLILLGLSTARAEVGLPNHDTFGGGFSGTKARSNHKPYTNWHSGWSGLDTLINNLAKSSNSKTHNNSNWSWNTHNRSNWNNLWNWNTHNRSNSNSLWNWSPYNHSNSNWNNHNHRNNNSNWNHYPNRPSYSSSSAGTQSSRRPRPDYGNRQSHGPAGGQESQQESPAEQRQREAREAADYAKEHGGKTNRREDQRSPEQQRQEAARQTADSVREKAEQDGKDDRDAEARAAGERVRQNADDSPRSDEDMQDAARRAADSVREKAEQDGKDQKQEAADLAADHVRQQRSPLTNPYTSEPLETNGQGQYWDDAKGEWVDRHAAEQIVAELQGEIGRRDREIEQRMDQWAKEDQRKRVERLQNDGFKFDAANDRWVPGENHPETIAKRRREQRDRTVALINRNVKDLKRADFLEDFIDRVYESGGDLDRAKDAVLDVTLRADQQRNMGTAEYELEKGKEFQKSEKHAVRVRDTAEQVNSALATVVPGGQKILRAQRFIGNAAENGIEKAVKDEVTGEIRSRVPGADKVFRAAELAGEVKEKGLQKALTDTAKREARNWATNKVKNAVASEVRSRLTDRSGQPQATGKGGSKIGLTPNEQQAIAKASKAGSIKEKARILKEYGISKDRRRKFMEGGYVCFLRGTLVATAEGLRPIETVKVGDRVLSRNEHDGRMGYKRVVRLFPGTTQQVCRVTVGRVVQTLPPAPQTGRTERHSVGSQSPPGSEEGAEDSDEPPSSGVQRILCTPGHDFHRVDDGTWVDAEQLQVGDRLLASDGSQREVLRVEVRGGNAPTWNFEVDAWHTYFVSADLQEPPVWVHNEDCNKTSKSGSGAPKDGIEYKLKKPSGVSDAEWQKKIDWLNEQAKAGKAKVVHNPKRNGKAQKQARKDGMIADGHHADHKLDLQFGGDDTVENIGSLNARVNMSVGGQGKRRLQYPDGTPIKKFVAED